MSLTIWLSLRICQLRVKPRLDEHVDTEHNYTACRNIDGKLVALVWRDKSELQIRL